MGKVLMLVDGNQVFKTLSHYLIVQ